MKELYTTAQAAEYLDLSISTVKYHVYQGNLKPEKPGHDLIFTKAMLDEFKQNKRGPGRPRKRKEQEDESARI